VIERTLEVLRAGPPLRLAVLFGSRATKRARANSDVDIAIVPRDGTFQFNDELRISSQLSKRLRLKIDLIRGDQASALHRFAIARDGVLLQADSPAEWSRFRGQAASEHAEIAEIIERTTNLFRQRPTRQM